MAESLDDLNVGIEWYRDLPVGTPVVARRNDAGIPVGSEGTVVRRIPETGNWQCVFDLPGGKRRVVAMCGDQVRPDGEPMVTETLRLVAAAHDPVQHDAVERQERRDKAVARLSTEEAQRRRAEGVRAYHERRRAEKASARLAEADEMLRGDGPVTLLATDDEPVLEEPTAEADGAAPAKVSGKRGPRIIGTPWSDEAKAAQSERMKARHAARVEAEREEKPVFDAPTPDEIERMRTMRDVPRTVRAVRAPSAWDQPEDFAAARESVFREPEPFVTPLPGVQSGDGERTEAAGFAEVERVIAAAAERGYTVIPDAAGELPVDWLAVAERQIRELLASAAPRATWREMGALWEIGRWLEERREGAA